MISERWEKKVTPMTFPSLLPRVSSYRIGRGNPEGFGGQGSPGRENLQGKVPEITGTHHTKGPFLGLQLSINDQPMHVRKLPKAGEKTKKKKKKKEKETLDSFREN